MNSMTGEIRAHPLLTELPALPDYEAPSAEVERWVTELGRK